MIDFYEDAMIRFGEVDKCPTTTNIVRGGD